VETVSEEKLNGVSDELLLNACVSESRCLITLDLDFADVLRFPPRQAAEIAVLRPPRTASLAVLTGLVQSLLAALRHETIAGRLWVVEAGRVRVHDELEL